MTKQTAITIYLCGFLTGIGGMSFVMGIFQNNVGIAIFGGLCMAFSHGVLRTLR